MYIWLRSITQNIQESRGLPTTKDSSMIIFKDNVVCIAQVKKEYFKKDKTKHISPNNFYTYELQEKCDIGVQQIPSSDNVTDLLTKVLSTSTFKNLVHNT